MSGETPRLKRPLSLAGIPYCESGHWSTRDGRFYVSRRVHLNRDIAHAEWLLWGVEWEDQQLLIKHRLARVSFPTRREALLRLQDALDLEAER